MASLHVVGINDLSVSRGSKDGRFAYTGAVDIKLPSDFGDVLIRVPFEKSPDLNRAVADALSRVTTWARGIADQALKVAEEQGYKRGDV